MIDKIKAFFITWGILLILNQIIFFGGCFKLYCLSAGSVHTGIIAFLLIYFDNKTKKEENILEKLKDEEKQQAKQVYPMKTIKSISYL